MAGVNYGYARVSTDRQDSGSDAQRRALEAAGCTVIVEERASGRKARPALFSLVDQLAPSDTIIVTRFDRVSRGVISFYDVGERISAKGASLRSLAEQFDTGTPIGCAMMGFAAIWKRTQSVSASIPGSMPQRSGLTLDLIPSPANAGAQSSARDWPPAFAGEGLGARISSSC